MNDDDINPSNDPDQSVMSDDDSVSNSGSVSQTDNATTDHLNDVDPATTNLTDVAIHQLGSNLTTMISNSYKVELEGHKEYLRLHYENRMSTMEQENASLRIPYVK